jgi:hypothetical protein
LPQVALKSNIQVLALSTNTYARWRVRHGPGQFLREDHDGIPPERLVQAIWQQQRILRDQLRTLDGAPVRILHPGFKNHGAGPDFREAMIQVGTDAPRIGDVEVDLRPQGWRAHGHDLNPAFRNVVLHVIWEGEKPGAGRLPTLSLRGRLDAPLGQLDAGLGPESMDDLPEELRGRCSAPLLELGSKELLDLLHQAADTRWRIKAGQFQARARQVGWEQSLWEGLFRALGYRQNVWPMQALAELRPLWKREPVTSLSIQARLMGVSGLLPDQLTRTRTSADSYLRQVWDHWWRERDEWSAAVLPRELWRFGGMRPANHPQRRLALAAHWTVAADLLPRLEKWFTTEFPDARLAESLWQILQVGQDDFWSWHWTFRSARLARPQPLLGAARVTDLAVNVILPWFWVRAVEGKNEALQRAAEHRFFHWPAAEDNSLLRLARRRLLGGARPRVLPDAAAQQGLLQITRDFCDHSNALCEECRFPELARSFVK